LSMLRRGVHDLKEHVPGVILFDHERVDRRQLH
jgi:hypothetical protein